MQGVQRHSPQLGEVRVCFEETPLQRVSVLAAQQGRRLQPRERIKAKDGTDPYPLTKTGPCKAALIV